jgi:hypothetical protein
VERLVWFRLDRFLESDLLRRHGQESKDSQEAKMGAFLVRLIVELGQWLHNRCWLLVEVKGVVPLCEWVSSSI